ncbi:MAG: hypothetical protein SRB1_02982 [Desulfobacteraceae bacterium Eth-SRB1]|nr:MAG: hypothetical protein SRB1_02982 [Desulfobacteraceae bacterium Eth-SRB1]
MFRGHKSENWIAYSKDTLNVCCQKQEIEYSNTNSKSVLGSMNDLAFHYKHHILYEGGVHSSALPGIIKKLNHMSMATLEYTFPIEALKAMYEKY